MEDALQSILEKLTNEWAPEILDLGVRMAWYTSLSNILHGFILLIIAAGALFAICKLGTTLNTLLMADNLTDLDWWKYVVLFAFALVIAVVAITVFFLGDGVLNIWNWIGLFDPKVRLAHDIYTAATRR